MFGSNIHQYFTQIELDPAVGWEILETAIQSTDEIATTQDLRRILAEAVSHFMQMDKDGETDERVDFMIAVKLLRSKLPLTWHEQRIILGEAVWDNINDYRVISELLRHRKVAE
jgi:hypothetical protein